MTIDTDDWRLQGQETYMTGVALRFIPWSSIKPEWDHDHCEFCSAKLAAPSDQEALYEGYATVDLYRWVCTECFKDFSEQFKWVIINNDQA